MPNRTVLASKPINASLNALTLVLLSGGIDSAVMLAQVIKWGYTPVAALAVDYGQQHAVELAAAEDIARHYDVPLEIFEVKLPVSSDSSSILFGSQHNPQDSEAKLTVVPGRNALLASIAVAYASANGIPNIYMGATGEDHERYMDCRPGFFRNLSDAFLHGYGVKLFAPFSVLNYSKAQVVATGIELGVPFELTWSCYCGDPSGKAPCMSCPACVSRGQAFEKNGRDYYGKRLA